MFKKLFQRPIVMGPAFFEDGSEVVGFFPVHDSDRKLSFPKYPELLHQPDEKQVREFHLLAINSSDGSVIADLPYKEGLKRMSRKVSKETDFQVIIKPLSLSEIYELFT